MNLLNGKSSLSATPMGGSVKKIVTIIEGEMRPAVIAAHKSDQAMLHQLIDDLLKCKEVKDSATLTASPWNGKYKGQSKLHQRCRMDEAVKYSSKETCLSQQRALYQVKKLKCAAFSSISAEYGSTTNNQAIVNKAGSESVENYLFRLSRTICGKHVHGTNGRKKDTGGWGGGLAKGMLDNFLRHKHACEVATKEYNDKVKECKRKIRLYNQKKAQCNGFQMAMDSQSCKFSVMMKDTCEQYAGCYIPKKKEFKEFAANTRLMERDRKAEWRGLMRMHCIISAFGDGQVSDKEVDACKKAVVTTTHLIIKYPAIPKRAPCIVSKLYPSTGSYKRREFVPLPVLAKGQESVPCSGVEDMPTKPKSGSPRSCKCRRVTLEGHYSAGPLVACTKCLDVRKSKDKNSCPDGTKIFSPSTKNDWRTFLASTGRLAAPHWIIDITRPQNGCGGCKNNAMNWKNRNQKSWKTSDGSPWWLRKTKYSEPNGDYHANCFLNLHKPKSVDKVTFNDGKCNYHSKSYYCQKERLTLTPNKGSPRSCKCRLLNLAQKYSAGKLVRCEQCLDVHKSTQKNSCPKGMKLFSPRSRSDWKTFISSAPPLRAPHFIIDITRPANGCGGCKKYPMNSKVPQQATWRTKDGSAWWLRSTRYTQPDGDYKANCYMDLNKPPASENTVKFNDYNCRYHSRSYYCQPVRAKPAPKPKPGPPPARRLVVGNLNAGLIEEEFVFNQGKRLSALNSKRPNRFNSIPQLNYGNSNRAWSSFMRPNNYAARWSGFLVAKQKGKYSFKLNSDDGSRLYIDNRKVCDNDGLHSMRRSATGNHNLVKGQHRIRVEYFEKAGAKGVKLSWKSNKLGKGWKLVTRKYLQYKPKPGFKEEVFYKQIGKKSVPNLNRRPDAQRVVNRVKYDMTDRPWMGFTAKDGFAVRWSGKLRVTQGGSYRFSLYSDDGSRMFLNNKRIVNNDGLHGWRQVEGNARIRSGAYNIIVEFFEDKGKAGIWFRYMGPDTSNRMMFVGKHTSEMAKKAGTEVVYSKGFPKTPAIPKSKK
jgi:hypothetical protein